MHTFSYQKLLSVVFLSSKTSNFAVFMEKNKLLLCLSDMAKLVVKNFRCEKIYI